MGSKESVATINIFYKKVDEKNFDTVKAVGGRA